MDVDQILREFSLSLFISPPPLSLFPSQVLLKSVNHHGSLVLQQLLQFKKPVVVVDSLLLLSAAELLFLCCDKSGSHVIDIFFQSDTVKDSRRAAFIKKLVVRCVKNVTSTFS